MPTKMSWTTPYVIYRLENDGTAHLVSTPEDLAKAKYWLQYIGEPFDVLCKTPVHPKHSKTSDTPEYWSHKERTGKPSYTEEDWRKHWELHGWNRTFSKE